MRWVLDIMKCLNVWMSISQILHLSQQLLEIGFDKGNVKYISSEFRETKTKTISTARYTKEK